jgi:serine/threonine protein kinase
VADIGIGDLIADKYEVTRILGQGGMGLVVAARHRELDDLIVAIKLLRPDLCDSQLLRTRFLRSAAHGGLPRWSEVGVRGAPGRWTRSRI